MAFLWSTEVVFVDIGGNRELIHVLELIQLLSATMPNLGYVAVKSEALATELQKAPVKLEDKIKWWEDCRNFRKSMKIEDKHEVQFGRIV